MPAALLYCNSIILAGGHVRASAGALAVHTALILAGGHVRASAGALAVHTALILAGGHVRASAGALAVHTALRRFAAVSPFCFGYPAQPDIASRRIRIMHNHFDRPTLFFATRRQGRYPRSLEAFFFTPVDFLSVSRHDARAPLERTKDVDFRSVQLSTE